METTRISEDKASDLFLLLFDAEDGICLSENLYGTTVYHVDNIPPKPDTAYQYFSINGLKGKRSDANVTCFRNILLEFDNMPLRDQMKLLESIPKSTIVFSGGKSYHAIISLETPCKDRAEYNKLVKRIYDKVPGVDKQTKNPSRFSRTPEAIRDNGVKQDLIYIGCRITDAELEMWLGPAPEEKKPEYVEVPVATGRLLKASTMYFLAYGAENGSWNKEIFMATLDMTRAGIADSEIYERLYKITGKLDASDHRTIKSALYTAKKERN